MRKPIVSVTASDCEFEYYRGSGDGGQKKQKTSSACRCRHRPSGAVGQAQDHREQSRNRQLAFGRMANTKEFQAWIKLETMKRTGEIQQIEAKVEQEMKKIKTQVRDKSGRWVDWKQE